MPLLETPVLLVVRALLELNSLLISCVLHSVTPYQLVYHFVGNNYKLLDFYTNKYSIHNHNDICNSGVCMVLL